MSNSTETLTPVVAEQRQIFPPKSVSSEAQAFLSFAAQLPRWKPFPAHEDIVGWRQWIAELDKLTRSIMVGRDLSTLASCEELKLGGTRCFKAAPNDLLQERKQYAYLDIHGGALIAGGGDICAYTGMATALNVGMETWAVDYRMPPDFPYPAALDDCIAAYRGLLERYAADKVIVGGLSAGGNLAAALMLKARDEGLPFPAGLALLSPELDLTESGDSFQVNAQADVGLHYQLRQVNELYANGADLTHPYLSPLFGDFEKGYPPTFLQAGTRDIFLSNVARMHRALRKADVPVDLHIFEAMPHAGFFGAPEDFELANELRLFCDKCLKAS